jgi:hypothetical protein
MSNSILTRTTKNTTPHRKLIDEQFNRHNNKQKTQHYTQSKTMSNSILTTTTKNTTPHTKLNDDQLNPHNNKKKHNTTNKAKR